jgi:gamma-glutamylcyclotransferase (GGCT)/AIG2-like uncharacterized protein YtfP
MIMHFFAYGTLRRFESNYYDLALDKDSNYLYTCKLQGFDMYDLGGYPGVVEGQGTIIGDLFEAHNLAVLTRICFLEVGDGYMEKKVSVLNTEAIIYILESLPEDSKPIETGNWLLRNEK